MLEHGCVVMGIHIWDCLLYTSENAVALHQRLSAMMTGTYSDTQTVEQGSHIHVMNITNQEADNGIFALLFTKKSDSIDGSHLLHTVVSELLLVLGNVIHAERRNIIDGLCQTVGSLSLIHISSTRFHLKKTE